MHKKGTILLSSVIVLSSCITTPLVNVHNYDFTLIKNKETFFLSTLVETSKNIYQIKFINDKKKFSNTITIDTTELTNLKIETYAKGLIDSTVHVNLFTDQTWFNNEVPSDKYIHPNDLTVIYSMPMLYSLNKDDYDIVFYLIFDRKEKYLFFLFNGRKALYWPIESPNFDAIMYLSGKDFNATYKYRKIQLNISPTTAST